MALGRKTAPVNSNRLAGLFAAAVLSACGGGNDSSSASSNHDYDEQAREQYMLACQAEGLDEAECLEQLECLESRLRFEEYVRLDNDRAAGLDVPELTAAIEACADG